MHALAALTAVVMPTHTGSEATQLILRWFHIIAGITWVGLLYFFNLVSIAFMKELDPATRGKVFPALMTRALWWFRWAAVLTWLTGAYYLETGAGYDHGFLKAFLFRPSYEVIGVGAWLGTIMLFNVWALIWPNQKKILGLVQASDQEKNKARRVAFLTSRVNTMLSIPMLFFMVAQSHIGT